MYSQYSKYFLNIVDYHQWNRKIMHAYWLVFGGTLFAFALISLFAREPGVGAWHSLLHGCLIPSAIIAAMLGVTEWNLRSGSDLRHYFMLSSGTVFSIVIVNTLPDIPGIEMVFLPPLFGALTFYDMRKLYYSFAMNLASFLALYFLNPVIHDRIGTAELLVTLFALINSLIIVLSLMSRVVALQQALLNSTEHKQELLVQNTLMERLSKTDALTDLYNHKTFHEYLAQLLEQTNTTSFAVNLALVDIDNFKKINDTFGHWAGDQVLKRIAATMRSHLADGDFAFRYGGEEFAVLFTDKPLDQTRAVLERIRKEVEGIVHEELHGGNVTVSIGLQGYRQEMGRERFFKMADACLYEAKRNGKNRIIDDILLPEAAGS
ncbi:GGDEF domain-containing protein [Cohnella candidum]|uniref:Sensor domain-containing diguanylate cyclase n=1 Tax=Cohnella candidum TaxID=2674991 RepID=A0A3G3K2Y7_9BACL|nr:diguanylate cyclase [Cohnella candidum]AYQ74828.1 sensor domain-containing diguanylate cyclase [Cohnella candidum]